MKKLITLLLAFAGCVGTVSAWTTVKLLNSVEGVWSDAATTVMTDVGDGSSNYYYYILDSSTISDGEGNYYFRIWVSDDNKYYGSYENDFAILDYENYGGQESSYSFKLATDKTSKYIISIGYWDGVWHFTATTYSGTGNITFVKTNSFTNPYAYVYCNGGARLTGGWPGKPMNLNSDGTYSLSNVNIGKNSKVIISDNGSNQITDQSFTGDIVCDGSGTATTQSVPVSSYGNATFCSKYPLDFSTATDGASGTLTAYKITETNKSTGELTKVAVTKVPANTGVYIEGTASAVFTVSTTATASDIGTNMLVGTVNEITNLPQTQTIESTGYTNYILTVNKDGGDVATPKFFKVNTAGNKVLANKAYLQIPTASAARDFFWFAEDATAIESVAQKQTANGQVYNLAGQRVAQPTKGLYIVNGKKAIIK